MSTPADHGYVVCSRCLTWRPEDATVLLDVEGDVCIDREWCSKQAGVGKLDADTGSDHDAELLAALMDESAWTKGNVP